MARELLDKKRFLSGKLRIYSDGQEVGYIKLKPFSSSAVSKFYGNELIFENKGFFSFQTTIKDANNKEVIGRANSIFTLFKKRKIELTIDDQVYLWKPGGISGSKWAITDSNGETVIDAKLNRSDKLDTDSINNLMLTGLYFRANYQRNLEVVSSVITLLIIFLIIDIRAISGIVSETIHEWTQH